MHFFYSTEKQGDVLLLDPIETRHALKVLRHQIGDEIWVLDGMGNQHRAILHSQSKNQLTAKIEETKTFEKRADYSIHIAIAPTKSAERFEWFLEKATEIGVDEITPILCERSERRKINTPRCRAILIAAMKQCGNTFLPLLHEPLSFNTLIGKETAAEKAIAHCLPENRIPLHQIWKGHKNFMIAIGPEGDFTTKEITFAIQNKWIPTTLGTSRLRTETAGVYAALIAAVSES
jgi:16S rRNA (uracil1498-N3)-methyltransferase